MKKVILVLTVFVFILSGCDWFIGPAGPAGSAGPAGTDVLGTPLIFVPAGNFAEALAFSDRTLVSTGNTGSIHTSTDGTNWNDKSINADTLYWAAYGNGRFVTASNTQVFYSSDEGANWSEAVDFEAFDPINRGDIISGLVFGSGTFVAVGSTGSTSPQGFIMRSTDGNSWADCTPTSTPGAFVSVSYTNGQFIAVTNAGFVYRSTDGDFSSSSPVLIPQYGDTVKKIVYGNGRYLIVGEQSLVSTTDFTTFSTLYAGSAFVSAAFHGDRFTVLCSDLNGFCALLFTDGHVFFWPAGILPPPGGQYSDIQWVPWLYEGTYVISQISVG